MVLSSSDYRISNLYKGSYDPTSISTYKKIAGVVVALSILGYAWDLSQNRGKPLVNQLFSKLTGGRASTEGGVEVF